MKTVDLFQFNQLDIGSARQMRMMKNGKTAVQLVRVGAKGVNPVAVWVDAAISVADAINSYCKLQRAREITQQLQAQKRSLEHQLRNASKALEIDQNLWQMEQQQRSRVVQNCIDNRQQQAAQLLLQLKSQHKSLEMLLTQVRALRRQNRSHCPRLTELTQAADNMMQAQLACLVYALN
ncbi:hypothetical protein [uncultured Ferrimonas sp.]|uniref:hypothetical protein n=1 Tax=uncultured Ferrimonas sp. TaxID=432640 RepID=UPI0026082215|nr:hypothetical protein [uncultured Ferrimonas sp.]